LDRIWRGIFAIPQSPFHEDGTFDWKSLDSEIDFCLAAGAHGIVWPVMASQFSVLSEQERRSSAEAVIRRVGGRIPVVIGVACPWQEAAYDLARHAQAAGADAVVSLPPWEVKPTKDQAFAFYRGLARAVRIPVFIQNADGKFGIAMPPDDVARLVREVDGIDFVKEEVAPAGQNIARVLAACGPSVKGVFGGAGGKFMLSELHRGAAGNMPACEMTDVLSTIYERFAAGDEPGAREAHNVLLAYHNLHGLFGMGLTREILRRRGAIACAAPRYGRETPMDDEDRRELSIILEALSPYFRSHPPVR
jgi:4-hydroxy-tetrahydrodipicolinate synthase